MSQLLINLTGTINSTNFDEWKTDLIAQIQSVNQDLVTDNDFDTASSHVKSFKTAENALKNAKQSAINQAQEIQQLFASIDEITEEARQARLSLERQIKSRKSQIKEEHIQSGIEVIKAVIEEQSEDFKNGDLSHFLNRGRYESAVFGKAGISGLETGIKEITSIIKAEIAELSQHIINNKAKLDSRIEGYNALFQDYSQLVRWPEEQLESEIVKRIARYESEIKQRVNENLARENKPDHIQDGSEIEPKQVGDDIISQKRKYRIAIQMEATPDEANRIVNNINNDFSYYITELELSQNDNLCELCRKPIPAARSEAIPNATRCVECQDADERQEGPDDDELGSCPRCGCSLVWRQGAPAGSTTKYFIGCSAFPECRYTSSR